ncbi:MAG: hypothetical protein ABI175_19300, partial [Polyangiales bacterium]
GQYFPSLFEQLYLTSATFHVGQKFEVPSFTATIEQLNAQGEVLRVRFTFPKPLASPNYRFLAFDGTRWVRLDLQHPGEQRLVTATSP